MDMTISAPTFNISQTSSSAYPPNSEMLGGRIGTKPASGAPMANPMCSPPESLSSPSPTSSVDTVMHGTSSTISSKATTPQYQYAECMFRSKSNGTTSFSVSADVVRDNQAAFPSGFYTPPSRHSSQYCPIPRIYEDNEPQQQQTMSESSISHSTLEQIPKRRADGSPLQRPRARSLMPRPRPSPACSDSFLPARSGQHMLSTSREILGESMDPKKMAQLPPLAPSQKSFVMGEQRIQEQASVDRDLFWQPDPDDQEAVEISNKRAKNERRGATGRASRTTSWSSHQKPSFNRRISTNSMIGLGKMQLNDDTQQQLLAQQTQLENAAIGTIDAFMESETENAENMEYMENKEDMENLGTTESGENAQNMENIGDTEDAEDAENIENMAIHLTPKKAGPRRAPLSEISPRIVRATDISSDAVAQCIQAEEPPISRQLCGPLIIRQSLGPLMTRQPRKALTRPRLLIVNPFPINHSYWDEYANDTFNYLIEIEGRYDRYMYITPPSDFAFNRTILVQWLMELCYGYFRFQPVTLHAAVNLLDRYITVRTLEHVPLEKLQCVGMCALMIAGKLEENTVKFSTPDLCSLCDLYSTKEIASTELAILVALKFEVLVASATGFSDYFKRAIPEHPDVMRLIDFLCDLSLISHEFLDFNTSQIAASAMWIAMCAFGQDWNEELAILTGYTRRDLTPLSVLFKRLVCQPTDTLDLRLTLGPRYPLEQTLATLTQVLS
ncbi:G2/mitotic-specific cyclin [Mortierella sp. GBA30]|nr:G2/mitotic-specific cyclin [Mortierella sp. GBA30]